MGRSGADRRDAPFSRRCGSLIRRRALGELGVGDTVSACMWLLVGDQAMHRQPPMHNSLGDHKVWDDLPIFGSE